MLLILLRAQELETESRRAQLVSPKVGITHLSFKVQDKRNKKLLSVEVVEKIGRVQRISTFLDVFFMSRSCCIKEVYIQLTN